MPKTIECRTITITKKSVYAPEFDPETNEYYDKEYFYDKGLRGLKTIYTCRCRWGSEWQSNQEYKQHIKSDTHKSFIKDYHIYYKDVDKQEEIIKELRIENESMKKELEVLKKKLAKSIKKTTKKLESKGTLLTELD
tara:strand:- start:1143 stop:1553 length:411 start_codon:yes stop_codon:yes gene_type:complete